LIKKEFALARNSIEDIEAMQMISKGQIEEIPDANVLDIKIFIEYLFELGVLAA